MASAPEIRPGTLVVAPPSEDADAEFGRAVIAVIDREASGITTGLLLNRPANKRAVEVSALATLFLPDVQAPAYTGGPLGEHPSILAQVDRPDGLEWFHLGMKQQRPFLLPDVCVVALGEHFDALDGRIKRARLFVGLCVWGRGQLEAELAREEWRLSSLQPDDPFTPDPEDLWSRVIARL